MSFCPVCKTEYQAGIEQCADCEVTLVETLPAEPAAPAAQPDWVLISTDHDEAEAYVLKGYLESEGIETTLENKSFHIAPVTAETLLNILVHQDQADLARQLLHEKEYLYKCSSCGAYCSLSDKVCSQCGEAIEEEDAEAI
ncbi:MAG: DUF2007 domain-containing protein [Acidobacteria bacterium]|nr:DUF2007 domain-containing protein [Acidobacteriota bacterium]MBI3656448.1 DUF2007 domain-containing protein [Acidobacteriota bacterium]